MKEIRRNLYENEKNLFTPKIKEIEKNLELEKNLSNLKKYYDYIVGPLLSPPPLLCSKNWVTWGVGTKHFARKGG